MEFQLLDLINADRAKNGLAPLKMQTQLRDYARQHAADELARGSIWHDMPQMQASVPGGYYALGENVAQNWSVSAMHAAYMNSPGHRANILSPNYNYIGIGMAIGANGVLYNSEDFEGNSATLPTVPAPGSAPAPTPTPTPSADTTAPTKPKRLHGRQSGPGAVTLSWTPSKDNVGVTKYQVRLNGSAVGSIRGAGAVVSGLARGTYRFSVRAFDAAGNSSRVSAIISVTVSY
jgi:hypothetical protein